MPERALIIEVPRVAVHELAVVLRNATEGDHAIEDCGWVESRNNPRCATCQLAVVAKRLKEAYNAA